MLCGLLLLIFFNQRQTAWTGVAIGACCIGILESLQISVCRMVVGDMKTVPTNVNLCDHVTGLPVGAVMVSLYLIIICWSLGHAIKRTR